MSARHTLTWRRVAGLTSLALLATFSHSLAADLATPTATAIGSTPAATPADDDSQALQGLKQAIGNERVMNGPVVFERGVQIGKNTDDAALLTLVKRGTCTVNPVSVGTDAFTVVSCADDDAAVGDFVVGNLESYNVTDYTQLVIVNSKVEATDVIYFTIQNTGADTVDAAPLTIRYLLVR